MREQIIRILQLFPEKLFIYLVFIVKLKYFPHLHNPRSLNEKLNYIKLNKTLFDLRCFVVDRIQVRNYVKDKVPECSLIKILWTGVKLNISIWEELPVKFVIKANHGSGMVKVIDKRYHSFDEVSLLSQEWLNKDYSKRGREWFYAKLKRYLVIEEFLEFNNEVPPDYKFFCFNGRVELVQVDLDRFNNHVRNLYNKKFNRIKGQLLYPQGYEIPKPDLYEQALSISEKLSKDFDFIRVDLYIMDKKIYFGELTNIPGNGFEPFYPRKLDFELGKKLELIKL